MAQPSIASYFNARKRAAVDEISSTRSKVLLLDSDSSQTNVDFELLAKTLLHKAAENHKHTSIQEKTVDDFDSNFMLGPAKRSRVVAKLNFDSPKLAAPKPNTRRASSRAKSTSTTKPQLKQTCIFKQLGPLSPVKKVVAPAASKPLEIAAEPKPVDNVQNNVQPKEAPGSVLGKLANKKELSLSEIKTKITRSSRLDELKSRINKLNEGMQKLDEKNSQKLEIQKPSLKEFKSINLEVTSPQKVLTSPRKTLYSPHKVLPQYNNGGSEQLMSPRKSRPEQAASRRLVLESPVKAAYQRYQGLAESATPSLTLPYNYRCLAELFRCVDAVCAMLYNRKETITFRKLKPAVQEMTRKNFTETHLAQIKAAYPDAYSFSQEKMHNFGSTSKQDKYELVIVPNVNGIDSTKSVEINADDVMKSRQAMSMNPQIMLERQRKLYNLLLDRVLEKHEEYLLSLDPPLSIPKNKLTRWHAGFDIESMPDLEKSALPQPPNVEKFTSATDVLMKARNLFNCNTRMERALERLAEAKSKNIPVSSMPADDKTKMMVKTEPGEVKTEPGEVEQPQQPLNPALKGVPKSLLEKIRAKQAAKALEAMTRSPAQDVKAIKYQRLPEIARHTRSVFVTEKKSVLPMELVLKKLGNSYDKSLTATELEQHLRLLSESLPGWLIFHEVRQTTFIKVSRDADMTKVQSRLEALVLKHSK